MSHPFQNVIINIQNSRYIMQRTRQVLFRLINPVTLEEGLAAEFYFSCMKVIGKKDIPVESI